jgi:hypothetical protein
MVTSDALSNKDRVFALHNGYDGYSYGSPRNPVLFTCEEMNTIVDCIHNVFSFNIAEEISKSLQHDVVLPGEVVAFIGYRCAGLYLPVSFHYDSEAEKEAAKIKRQQILDEIISLRAGAR